MSSYRSLATHIRKVLNCTSNFIKGAQVVLHKTSNYTFKNYSNDPGNFLPLQDNHDHTVFNIRWNLCKLSLIKYRIRLCTHILGHRDVSKSNTLNMVVFWRINAGLRVW